VRVPEQIAHGTMLRVLVSDADWLNRASRGFAFGGASTGPEGLDQLIGLLNRERHNDRLYVGLFAPSPTMLWTTKRCRTCRIAINIVDGRPGRGGVQILRGIAGERNVGGDGRAAEWSDFVEFAGEVERKSSVVSFSSKF